MSDYQSAAQTIRRLAVVLGDLTLAADLLDKIGSPTSRLAELDTQTRAAQAELVEVDSELAQARTNLEQVRVISEQVVRTANEDAGRIAKQAADDAEATRAATTVAVSELKRKADEHAASAVERAVAAAQAQLDAITAQVDAANAEANAAIAARSTAQAELDNINGLLAEARAKVASLING